jgi:hypothetical protein
MYQERSKLVRKLKNTMAEEKRSSIAEQETLVSQVNMYSSIANKLNFISYLFQYLS